MAVYYFAPTTWYSKYFAQPLITLSSVANSTPAGMRMHKPSVRDPVNKFGNIGERPPASKGLIAPTLEAPSDLGHVARNNVWQQLNKFSMAIPQQSEILTAPGSKPSFGHSDGVARRSEYTAEVDDFILREPEPYTFHLMDEMECEGGPEPLILSPTPRHFDAVRALKGWESALALEDAVVDVDGGQTRDFIRAPGKPRTAFPNSTKGTAIPASASVTFLEEPVQTMTCPVAPTTKEDLWKSAASLFDFSYMKRCNIEDKSVTAVPSAGVEETIPKDRSRLLTILGY